MRNATLGIIALCLAASAATLAHARSTDPQQSTSIGEPAIPESIPGLPVPPLWLPPEVATPDLGCSDGI